jgi:hypothetical protein
MTYRGRRRQPTKLSERLTIVMSTDLRVALERRSEQLDTPMAEIARKLLMDQLLPKVEKV